MTPTRRDFLAAVPAVGIVGGLALGGAGPTSAFTEAELRALVDEVGPPAKIWPDSDRPEYFQLPPSAGPITKMDSFSDELLIYTDSQVWRIWKPGCEWVLERIRPYNLAKLG